MINIKSKQTNKKMTTKIHVIQNKIMDICDPGWQSVDFTVDMAL